MVCRRYLLYSLISALVGVGLTFVIVLGQSNVHWFQELASGAVIGISINTVIFALEIFWIGRLRSLLRVPPVVLRVPHYILGGVLGFLAGDALSWFIFPDVSLVPAGALRFWLPFMGIFSLVVGLLIYAYEEMRQRLRASVEQIKEQEFAQKELLLARSIQERLLPPRLVEGEGYSVAARNLAAAYVAGDFYDVFRLGEHDRGLVVADVAGKGMGASLIMASAKAMLPFIAAEHPVAETLSLLNERLADDLGPREFVALAFARFRAADHTVEIGNAGLPDPYLMSADGRVKTLEVSGDRLPLGARRGIEYESRSWRLEEGDRLLMFSDGLVEAPAADGTPLGYEELIRLLPKEDLRPALWIEALFAALRRGKEQELADDWTALLLHVHGT